jgi:hypothetical protein
MSTKIIVLNYLKSLKMILLNYLKNETQYILIIWHMLKLLHYNIKKILGQNFKRKINLNMNLK